MEHTHSTDGTGQHHLQMQSFVILNGVDSVLYVINHVCCLLCWLLLRTSVFGEEPCDPFFEGFKRTGSLIADGIVAGIPVNCSLDSGLSISVIDLDLAPKLPQQHREPDVKTGSGFQATKVL